MKQYYEPHGWLSVLTAHTVRVGGHAYYVDDLPHGREEGTGILGERPGRWMGAGAAALGLTERVEPEAFADVLSGRNPLSGRALPVNRNRVTVAGYDLVFCAPKSVSLLHLLGPSELASEVGAGHDAAVEATTGYLAQAALGVRRRTRGQPDRRPLATTGPVAGAFVHRTSRALDPHLHTHVVAANVAQGVDGVWSAVDSRRLFAHARVAGCLYQAHLRHELTNRLGVAWEVHPGGLGDVVGVDPVLRGIFSQRSAAMREYVAERSGRASFRGAFYATRPDKDTAASLEALGPVWRRRADELGLDVGDLGRVVGRHRGGEGIDVQQFGSTLAATARPDATLSRRDIISAVAAAHISGGRVEEVEAAADRLCARAHPSDDRQPGHDRRWAVQAVSGAVRRYGNELTRPSMQRDHADGDAGARDPRSLALRAREPRAREPGARHTPDRERVPEARDRERAPKAPDPLARARGPRRPLRHRHQDRGMER